jgi:hypothetical protein
LAGGGMVGQRLRSQNQIQTNITGATTYTSANIWTGWNEIYYGSTAVTTIASGWPLNSQGTGTGSSLNPLNPWPHWNQTYTTGSIAGTNMDVNIWSNWIEEHGAHQARRAQAVARPSEAQVAAALEQERRWRAEGEERARKIREAEAKAEKLLRSCLSAEQIEQLETRNCFYVEVREADGKKQRYRIDRGFQGNVKQVDEKGSIIRSFCIHPDGVPIPDVMLAQKLWLEASEETRAEFWETANITALMREKDVPYQIPRKERYRYAREHGLLH